MQAREVYQEQLVGQKVIQQWYYSPKKRVWKEIAIKLLILPSEWVGQILGRSYVRYKYSLQQPNMKLFFKLVQDATKVKCKPSYVKGIIVNCN